MAWSNVISTQHHSLKLYNTELKVISLHTLMADSSSSSSSLNCIHQNHGLKIKLSTSFLCSLTQFKFSSMDLLTASFFIVNSQKHKHNGCSVSYILQKKQKVRYKTWRTELQTKPLDQLTTPISFFIFICSTWYPLNLSFSQSSHKIIFMANRKQIISDKIGIKSHWACEFFTSSFVSLKDIVIYFLNVTGSGWQKLQARFHLLLPVM